MNLQKSLSKNFMSYFFGKIAIFFYIFFYPIWQSYPLLQCELFANIFESIFQNSIFPMQETSSCPSPSAGPSTGSSGGTSRGTWNVSQKCAHLAHIRNFLPFEPYLSYGLEVWLGVKKIERGGHVFGAWRGSQKHRLGGM